MFVSFDQALRYHRDNNFAKAKECYLALLKIQKHNSKTNQNIHYLLGLLYSQNKDYLKSIKHLECVLSKHIANAEIYHALALCYHKIFQVKPAERFITIALSLTPHNENYCNRKSKILLTACKYQKSLDNSLACISSHPKFTPAYLSYIQASNKINRPDNSLRIIKRAYKENPTDPEILFSLASTFNYAGNHKKSASIFTMLYKNNYKKFECLNNLANIEREYGDIKKAKYLYVLAMSLQPNNPVTLWNLSLLDLATGNFDHGWKNYDQRLNLQDTINHKRKSSDNILKQITPWNGESLKQKAILIISEQGLGDEILFSSSFAYIADQAKHVILLCSSRIKPIFKQSFPQINCFDTNEISIYKNEITQCHYKIQSGSIFQFIKKNITVYPYLVPNRKPNKTSNRHKNKPKIGISWKGGEKYSDTKKRSIQIKKWLPLITNIGSHIEIFCLQHNITEQEKKILDSYSPNINFLPSNNDITYLVNQISQLDLVISTTNTNVHIAGALGVNTLCLAPHNPDWPWGTFGEECHWYKSVRILRQKNKSWNGIFDRVIPYLKEIEKSPKL